MIVNDPVLEDMKAREFDAEARRYARKLAAEQGNWLCPCCHVKRISANKSLCLACRMKQVAIEEQLQSRALTVEEAAMKATLDHAEREEQWHDTLNALESM